MQGKVNYAVSLHGINLSPCEGHSTPEWIGGLYRQLPLRGGMEDSIRNGFFFLSWDPGQTQKSYEVAEGR